MATMKRDWQVKYWRINQWCDYLAKPTTYRKAEKLAAEAKSEFPSVQIIVSRID